MSDNGTATSLFAGELRHSDKDFNERLERLAAASSLFDPVIEQRTRAIVEAVGARGDQALLDFTTKFDGAQLTPAQIRVSQAELATATKAADPGLRRAVTFALKNIQSFSRHSLRGNWTARNQEGANVGEKFDPFQRVGLYIPGGTAPLVSTALMTIGLAKVAGCPEIVVCTPCARDGKINSALLYAVAQAGATEVYRAGGSQAIAAMALGTKTIRRVQKVFGPGNAYVVAAKRLLFGHVAVDLLPGPSEVLVLADDTANPAFAAADLLAQAEHGSGHERVWLVTTSAKTAQAVQAEAATQLSTRSRKEFIAKALKNSGWIIQAKSMDQAITVVNRLAPEHCEVMTRDTIKVARRITTAGAIFLGAWSPTVLGDYVAGPSHTLPTGGAGASFAGLTVDQFQRRTSIVGYDRAALGKALPFVQKFADLEGLDAHARSASIRLDSVPKTGRKR
ncbi:MAG TPA: histidinol dehydrogenase [Verrucomicrobiae bacterium]|nr:histidinol dehydrogenase [Verrucomicrobiae bacterium]